MYFYYLFFYTNKMLLETFKIIIWYECFSICECLSPRLSPSSTTIDLKVRPKNAQEKNTESGTKSLSLKFNRNINKPGRFFMWIYILGEYFTGRIKIQIISSSNVYFKEPKCFPKIQFPNKTFPAKLLVSVKYDS